jgi:hypothetical protein
MAVSMIATLYLLRSRAARAFGKTFIDPEWDGTGPTPFVRNYGAYYVAVVVAVILATILRAVTGQPV